MKLKKIKDNIYEYHGRIVLIENNILTIPTKLANRLLNRDRKLNKFYLGKYNFVELRKSELSKYLDLTISWTSNLNLEKIRIKQVEYVFNLTVPILTEMLGALDFYPYPENIYKDISDILYCGPTIEFHHYNGGQIFRFSIDPVTLNIISPELGLCEIDKLFKKLSEKLIDPETGELDLRYEYLFSKDPKYTKDSYREILKMRTGNYNKLLIPKKYLF